MTPRTRQKITALYWKWHRCGRDDLGLPQSLAELLHHAKWFFENGDCVKENISLEQLSQMTGLPVDFGKN